MHRSRGQGLRIYISSKSSGGIDAVGLESTPGQEALKAPSLYLNGFLLRRVGTRTGLVADAPTHEAPARPSLLRMWSQMAREGQKQPLQASPCPGPEAAAQHPLPASPIGS